jgi:chromosome segregation ATPase
LWALPTVTETEKEMVFKEYLADLDQFEQALAAFQEAVASQQKLSKDENDLLRSLMGVPQDDLKVKILTLSQDLIATEKEKAELADEGMELRRRTAEFEEENTLLRKKLHDYQHQAEQFRLQQIKLREDDIKYFGETHEALKNNLKDLESRLVNLRSLFTDSNKQLLTQKQEEISLLQKKLLDEMEVRRRCSPKASPTAFARRWCRRKGSSC